MSLIILIPTFKRPDTLYWSLKSVISQKFYGNNLSKSIHILNNDPFINVQYKKLALLAGADFVSEYIDDYMSGRALSFFR